MSDRLRVLLLTEGAYPYVKGGGVSTWAEMMCNRLEDRVDFLMQCYVGNPYMELQYDLPANIKSVTKVPLWGSEFPIAYYQPERMFSSIASEQEFTGAEQVEEEFLPHFESLLELLVDPYSASGAETGLLIYRLWDYFNSHSYKDTLRRESVWHTFREKLTDFYSQSAATRKVDSFNLLNATFGMRWLYHYLMPLDVDVPEVDLIHSASAGFTTIAGIVGKFRYGTPFVVSDHGVYIRERIKGINEDEGMGYYSKKLLINLSMLVTKAAYHYADVICPVASTHRDWEVRFGGSEEKIQVIVNGVDIDKFRPLDLTGSKTYDRPTVVALANLFPLKDIETMIDTCDRVRDQIPDVQFKLFGDTTVDPDYTEKCHGWIADRGLENHFFIEGFHNNPTEVYNKGDLLILTSISEGAPYTVLESMSCGCPVVATDVGGVRDVLERCGIICRPGAADELTEGVVKLLEDDLFRTVLGRESRRIVLNNFTAEKSVNAYYEQYRTLAGVRRFPLKTITPK